jgi:hypothetical protein
MQLVLDHVILRSRDPAADVAVLEQAGLPLVVGVTHLAGTIHSGLVAAGSVDVEVLQVGGSPPDQVEGYGLGLRAPGTDQWEVVRILRERGLRTSAPSAATVEHDGQPRTWSTVHVAGLLPEPFPLPFSDRPPGRRERLTAALGARLVTFGPVAAAATRRPGRSMVVVTEYGFDVDAQRAARPPGPELVEVEIGVGDAADAWAKLGVIAGPHVDLRSDGPMGIRRVVLSGPGWDGARELVLGDVSFVGR